MKKRADLVSYRLSRAKQTLKDAQILADTGGWNSAINRLYYSAFYAVGALLVHNNLHPSTHSGASSNFNQHFVATGLFDKALGKSYAQLFHWRQKGDYDDFFDFDEERVMPYFEEVGKLVIEIEKLIYEDSLK